MDRQKKKTIIQNFQKHNKDTGSPSVQIMILTERILEVTSHLEEHKKDHHSRRGLLKMVENRKKLLRYLQENKAAEFDQVKALMEEAKSKPIKKTVVTKKEVKKTEKAEKKAAAKTAKVAAKKAGVKKESVKKPAKKVAKKSAKSK